MARSVADRLDARRRKFYKWRRTFFKRRRCPRCLSPQARKDRSLQILVLVCLGQFMLLVDDTIVNVALPSIQADLGFSESGLTWVANAYFLALGGFLLLGGKAADLLGRRRVLVFALAAFATASAICGLAPELRRPRRCPRRPGPRRGVPLARRPVHPPGDVPRRPRAYAGARRLGGADGRRRSDRAACRRRPRARRFDWRWVFLINVPVALVVVPLVRRIVPADPPATRPRAGPDVLGAMLGTAALLVFTLTVDAPTSTPGTSAWTLGGIAVAVALASARSCASGARPSRSSRASCCGRGRPWRPTR